MSSYVPPTKGVEYIFYVGLVSQADIKLLQNNPTLAAGDVLVSTDGGATSNLDTLPAVTPASSDMVKVTVSTTEMNGDNIIIVFSDAAGSEWCDLIVNIQTAAQSLDTMDTNIDDIETDTAVIGALGAGLTDLGGMSTGMKAEIEAECTDAIEADGLDHLVAASVAGADIVDNSIIAKMVSKDATADWDDFVNTTDALQAIRDKETDIETDTAVIGALGAGLTNIPWNSSWDSEAQSECADALTVYDPPTKTEMDTGHGLLATEAKQDTIDTVVDAIKAITDNQPWFPKKNVAFANFPFFMVLSSDHVTGATSKTVTVQISEDGGSFVTSTNSAAEIGSGFYKISFTQAEMNCDTFAWKFSASGCDTQAVTGATTT